MPESTQESTDFGLDLGAVALIVGFGLLVTPTVIFVGVWLLTHRFDFAAMTPFEMVAAALSLLVGILVVRATVRELAGGLGVRIDEQGLSRGATTIRWDEVDALEAPQFGWLDVVAGERRLRLRTYLFRRRRQLLSFIAARTGKTAPELGNGL